MSSREPGLYRNARWDRLVQHSPALSPAPSASAASPTRRASTWCWRKFMERFDAGGTLTIREFAAGPAAHVEIIDLSSLIPALATAE